MNLRLSFGCVGLLILSGCASLPDTQPFLDGTLSLRSAVAATGATTISELKRIELATPANQRELAEQIAKLEREWQARVSVMSALVSYAESIQGIVDAGKKGDQSVKALTDSADTLMKAVGSAGLAGSVASLAVETATFVGGEIIKARAAKSLEESLRIVQPAMVRLAELLSADANDLAELTRSAVTQQLMLLDDRYEKELVYYDQLLATRRGLLVEIRTSLGANAEISKVESTEALGRVDALVVGAKTWRQDYLEERQSIVARGRVAEAMLTELQSAFPAWAAAHGKLLTAVRTKRMPPITELTATADRIRGLLQRYREL